MWARDATMLGIGLGCIWRPEESWAVFGGRISGVLRIWHFDDWAIATSKTDQSKVGKTLGMEEVTENMTCHGVVWCVCGLDGDRLNERRMGSQFSVWL